MVRESFPERVVQKTRAFRPGRRCSDVREVVVEPAQVVVVLLVVQSWKDAAASQLRQILENRGHKQTMKYFQGKYL